MGRAIGSNAKVAAAFEASPGVTPASNFFVVPFVSHSLGEERPLIASNLLGYGREPQDPIPDVATDDGDMVVPVDVRNIGRWLKLAFGAPVTTGVVATATGGFIFTAQPAAGSVLYLNGTAFTFVAAAPTGNQILIGANLAATLTNAAAVLNASTIPAVALATYSSNATTLTVTFDVPGTAGNSFTLNYAGTVNANSTGGTLAGGSLVTHTFTSGAASLPSMSIEIGAPEVPAYSVNYGARLNQLKIGLARSGLLDATVSLIAIGETTPIGASVAGAPTSLPSVRFAQASGGITKDGVPLGSVVGAEFTFSNSLDKVETIKSDGRIEDSDPGMVMMSGSLTTKFKDTVLLSAATAGTPCELDFGWVNGQYSLTVKVPRVFLPPTKRPIPGPKGVQAAFNWQASGPTAASVTVVLVNDVASYAN